VVLAASDPRLSHDRRVLGPDLRGFGWSQAPSGDYGKAKFAADVLRLIDAAGLERVDIVGHDWVATQRCCWRSTT
jgi:pimeloyl-ACP methyl ester carboxylesterase